MAVVDVDAIGAALKAARRSLAATFRDELLSTYNALASDAPFAVNREQVGARRRRGEWTRPPALPDDGAPGGAI